MPYDRITELPEQVRDLLSKQAQLIYKEAFNNAWSHFTDLDECRGDFDLDIPVDDLARQVALNAVKRVYESQDEK